MVDSEFVVTLDVDILDAAILTLDSEFVARLDVDILAAAIFNVDKEFIAALAVDIFPDTIVPIERLAPAKLTVETDVALKIFVYIFDDSNSVIYPAVAFIFILLRDCIYAFDPMNEFVLNEFVDIFTEANNGTFILLTTFKLSLSMFDADTYILDTFLA